MQYATNEIMKAWLFFLTISAAYFTQTTANVIGSAEQPDIPLVDPTPPQPNHDWDRDENIDSLQSTAGTDDDSQLNDMSAHRAVGGLDKTTNNNADIPDRELDVNDTEKRGREDISNGGNLPTRPDEPVTDEPITDLPNERNFPNQTTRPINGHESENVARRTTKSERERDLGEITPTRPILTTPQPLRHTETPETFQPETPTTPTPPEIRTPFTGPTDHTIHTPLHTRPITHPPEIEDNTIKPEETIPTTSPRAIHPTSPTTKPTTSPATTTTTTTTSTTSPITTISPTSPTTPTTTVLTTIFSVSVTQKILPITTPTTISTPTRPIMRQSTGTPTTHRNTPYAQRTTKMKTTKNRFITVPSSSNRTTILKPLTTASTQRPTTRKTTKTTPVQGRSAAAKTTKAMKKTTPPQQTSQTPRPIVTTIKVLPSNPTVYFTITLKMNWCQFCEVKDNFKLLILDLVRGDNLEVEVVIYENLNQCVQCKPSLKQKTATTPIQDPPGGQKSQNTGRRPAPRLKRGIISNSQTMWTAEKEYITLKVSVNDRSSGKANKGLTEMASQKLTVREELSESFRDKISSVELYLEEDFGSGNPDEQEDDKFDIIIYITVSCVMAICLVSLIIIAVVIVRRRGVRQRSHSSMRPSVRYRGGDDDAFSLNSYTIQSFRRSGRKQLSQRSIKTIAGSVNDAFYPDQGQFTNAMTLSCLSTRSLESDYLEEELKMIPMNMPKMGILPQAALAKNRYANVIPLESSRVMLQKKSRGLCTEYINANYVRGYNNTPNVYIATQAPLDSTVVDFWRMVWENQSQVIIMLMHWYEDNQRRCAQYLPDNDMIDSIVVFGEFEIFMKKKVVTADYISTHIKLKHMDLNLCRDVVHFQYIEFPMKSCPIVTSLIKFIQFVRPYTEASHGPSIVHCTTGTGRTGVFIALDLSIQVFDDSNTVDIMNCVYKLRQDRAGSVHSVTHYAFLYKAMLEYANRGSRFPSHMGSIQSLDAGR